MKIGIYSGSFNPIHIGHLALANYICEFEGIDEVWFMVSPQNPFKEKGELLDDELRYQLVQESIAGYPRFKASRFEFQLPQPSYTIHTLRELSRSYPQHQFQLIIGADNWEVFPKWRESEQLLKEYEVMVYPRKGHEINPTTLPKGVRRVDSPIMEISSTFIRQAMRDGKDVRFFLPANVYDKLKACVRF